MDHALNILNEFCENAWSKIDILNKIECILLRTLKILYNELFGVNISNKAVRCLEIWILYQIL